MRVALAQFTPYRCIGGLDVVWRRNLRRREGAACSRMAVAGLVLASLTVGSCGDSSTEEQAPTIAEQSADVVSPGPEPSEPIPESSSDVASDELAAAYKRPVPDTLWPIVALLFGLVAAGSLWVAIYLFLWRRRLPDGQLSILPEVVLSATERLRRANADQIDWSRATSEEHKHIYNDIRKAFGVFSSVAAEKDAQIRRLSEGSDRQVYSHALRRFIRVLRLAESDIAEDAAAGRDTSAVESLRRHLRAALLDVGLEHFEPTVGSDFRTRSDVADDPQVVWTQEVALDWTISRTVSAGYLLPTAADPIVVEKAMVEIYRVEA